LVSFYSGRLKENPDLRLKFLVTSRPYDSVKSEFFKLSKVAIFISFRADEKYSIISEEINLVIDYKLPLLVGRKIDAEGQSQITKHLKAFVQRTYLWLYLIFEVIKKKISGHSTAKKV
jgi:ankyrin repeat domain-containing protein 50